MNIFAFKYWCIFFIDNRFTNESVTIREKKPIFYTMKVKNGIYGQIKSLSACPFANNVFSVI